MKMRAFIAILIAAFAFAEPASACFALVPPKPDHLGYADTVAKVRLLKVERGPRGHLDYYGITDSAFLTFGTIQTYVGPHKNRWRVVWRGGQVDRVMFSATQPRGDGAAYFDTSGGYHFPSKQFEDRGSGGRPTSLRIGDVYIVGITPAKKQFDGRGCNTEGKYFSFFDDGEGGYRIELMSNSCSAGLPYAFPFSDTLEVRVLSVLRSGE